MLPPLSITLGWGAQDAGLGGQVYDRESIMKGMGGMGGMPGMGGALLPPPLLCL